MGGKSDRFGINVIACCREHERYLKAQLDRGSDIERLLAYHDRRIAWLAHERLVHLLVTMLTAFLFFFLVGLELCLKGSIPVLLLLAVVFPLLAAYLFHYFRLENTVQHWYRISDALWRQAEDARVNSARSE